MNMNAKGKKISFVTAIILASASLAIIVLLACLFEPTCEAIGVSFSNSVSSSSSSGSSNNVASGLGAGIALGLMAALVLLSVIISGIVFLVFGVLGAVSISACKNGNQKWFVADSILLLIEGFSSLVLGFLGMSISNGYLVLIVYFIFGGLEIAYGIFALVYQKTQGMLPAETKTKEESKDPS